MLGGTEAVEVVVIGAALDGGPACVVGAPLPVATGAGAGAAAAVVAAVGLDGALPPRVRRNVSLTSAAIWLTPVYRFHR